MDFINYLCNQIFQNTQKIFTSHLGIGSTALKGLDNLFSNCLITVSAKVSNVSIVDMQDSHAGREPIMYI